MKMKDKAGKDLPCNPAPYKIPPDWILYPWEVVYFKPDGNYHNPKYFRNCEELHFGLSEFVP
jgi:hypothetical protein